jgi:hypothetical protein
MYQFLVSGTINRIVIIFGFTESYSNKICYFSKSTASHSSTLAEHLANLIVIWQGDTPASYKPVPTSGWNCVSVYGSVFLYQFLHLSSNKCSVIVKNIGCMINKSSWKSQVTSWSLFFTKRSENRAYIGSCVLNSDVVVCCNHMHHVNCME